MRNTKEQRARSKEQSKPRGLGVYLHFVHFSLFTVLFLLFTSCNNPLEPAPGNNPVIPADKGSIYLSVTVVNAARTILPVAPNKNELWYDFVFTPLPTGTPVQDYRDYAGLSDPIFLDPGTYRLLITAYYDEDKTEPVAQGGIENLVITARKNISRTITLKVPEEGMGYFTYNVTFPDVETADMNIKPLATTGTPEQDVILLDNDGTGSLPLITGYYNVEITLIKDDGQTLVWWEMLHIYAYLKSDFTISFEDDDFYRTAYIVRFEFNDEANLVITSSVAHGDILENKPDDPIRRNAVAGLYSGNLEDYPYWTFDGWYKDGVLYNSFDAPVTTDLTFTAQWTPPASYISSVDANNVATAVTYVNAVDTVGTYTLLLNNSATVINTGVQAMNRANANLTIIGLGGECTIVPTGVDVTLFTVSNANASLTLGNNITLRGVNNSTVNLVNVTAGNLTMLEGSKITGHITTAASAANGVVQVTGATSTFIMEGGEIIDNKNNSTANTTSGGVYVGENGATFRMSGGTISGNFSAYTSTNNPADINIHEAATFILSGNAKIGALVLYKFDNPPNTASITLEGSYTGTVDALHLRRNVAITTAIGEWVNQTLIKGKDTYTVTASDIVRFTLGKFICNTSDEDRNITGNATGNNYRIDNTSANMGKLVREGNEGTENDPFLISTPDQLKRVGTEQAGWDMYAYYKLVANIDMIGVPWTPIGDYYNYELFLGTLDGDGKSISNLTIYAPDEDFQGLFAATAGTVRNLTLSNCKITGANIVGGIAAGNAGTIENCHTSGTITGTDDGFIAVGFIGGVVGNNTSIYDFVGKVIDCSSACNVSGYSNVGGVVGRNGFTEGADESSTVINCYATGNIEGRGLNVGGVVGENGIGLTVKNCYYTTGTVSGNSRVGGVVGNNDEGTVEDCYATGSVSGTGYNSTNIGGVVGSNSFGTVINCYATGSVSSNSNSSKNIGGVVGNNSLGIVKYCYAIGNVEGYENVGGVVGENTRNIGDTENTGIVEKCYAIGNLSGDKNVGGVAGTNLGTVINCYAQGDVNGDESVGGVIGRNTSRMENCYATGNVSGDENVGGVAGINPFSESSTMKNCVALNKEITIESESTPVNYGRVIGNDNGTFTNNYGRDDMALPDDITPGPRSQNGTDVNTATAITSAFWTTAGNWDGGAWNTTAWDIDNGRLPILYGMPETRTQNPEVRE